MPIPSTIPVGLRVKRGIAVLRSCEFYVSRANIIAVHFFLNQIVITAA